MLRARRSALRRLVLLADVAVLVASMFLARALHDWLRPVLPLLKAPPSFHEYAQVVYAGVPIVLFFLISTGLHALFERRWQAPQLLATVIKAHILGFVGLTVILFLTQAVVNRSLVVLFLTSSVLLMSVAKLAMHGWWSFQHGAGQVQDRLLLVGDAAELSAFLRNAAQSEFQPLIVGYLGGTAQAAGFPARLGELTELERVLHEHAVDRVLFFAPRNRPGEVPAAIDLCATLGIPAEFSIDLSRSSSAAPRVVQLYDQPFISFEVAPKSPSALLIKHGFDFVAALLGVLVLAPLFGLIALAVAISMGRPIFFLQERGGLYGRRFRMIKFRTMVHDAESSRDALLARNEMTGPVFKIANDPRVTALGRFLRRTSLDELPQLFNVLGGSMSLVGPRPLPTKEQQQMRGWHRRRLTMKPGITGLWQVSGRNDVDFEQWMKLDLRYVDEWSLRGDVKLLLKTVPAVLFVRGAR